MPHLLYKYRHTLLALLIACSALARSLHRAFQEDRAGAVIFSDAQGYYMYLPSVFIHGNFRDFPLAAADGTLVYPSETVKNKYTYPVALLQMPFYLAADAIAALGPYPRDGRSLPYICSILLAGAFYLGLGIYLLGRLLSKFFRFHLVAATLLALFLGTNLYYYSALEPGVSHVYSFFLFALFWSVTEALLKHPRKRRFTMLGFVYGLIVVLRPTNAIIALLFLVWRAFRPKDLGDRISLFFKDASRLPLFIGGLALALLPQVLYWRHAFGEWIVYSYGGEGFLYWNDPKMLKVLFDVQNGWLLYSPLMLIALAGIVFLIKNKDYFGWGLILMLALATYAFGSWWAWWFGGAFGHRCYVEYTALLSLPLALSFRGIMRWHVVPRFLAAVFVGVLLYYNLALTETYLHTGPWDGPAWTWERYFQILRSVF